MLPLLEAPPPCPACGASDVRPLHVYRNIKGVVASPFLALLGCRQCGLAYTSPRPTEEDLARHYDPDSEGGWVKGQDYDDPSRAASLEKWLRNKHASGRKLLAHAAAFVPLNGSGKRRAFDFGCGGGAFLDVLQDEGWTTIGLEPARLREFARKRHVIVDRIADAAPFDLVNVHHVLEHLLEPADVLRALAQASAADAVLLCSVPDLEGLPRHGDFRYASNPVHLNSFTTASLSGLLQRTGWRPLHVDSARHLPDPTGDDTRRLIGIARRDPQAASLPLPREPLRIAEDALRAYGRMLGVDGKIVSAVP